MAQRTKIKSLMVACNSFLQIPHLSQLFKAGENIDRKAIEGRGAIWMAGRTKIKRLAVACDGFLQVLHISEPVKACRDGGAEAVKERRAIWMAGGRKTETVKSNYTIEEVVTERRLLCATRPSAKGV